MTLGLAWRRVRWPLRRPLVVGGVTQHERVVMEVAVRDDRGRTGVGEAAPLPGLHDEGVDDLPPLLPAALRALPPSLARETFRSALERLTGDATWRALPPSLRCGLEGALLDFSAAGMELALPLERPVGDPPPASALIDDTDTCLPPDCRCVKLKVGRHDRDREVARILDLRRIGGDDLEIRLDANRAFSLADALAFAAAVRPARPIWIEEPVAPAHLPAFLARGGLAVALDESLHEPGAAPAALQAAVAAWVLKPARFGIGGTLDAFARARGVVCVISSSFESPRGLALLAALARCAPGLPAPGLGTDAWFTGASEPFEEWTDVVP